MHHSPDLPIDDPQEDCLGYGTFASKLTEGTACQTCLNGLALAIHGAWGQGKASTLNLTLRQLASVPEVTRPMAVKFNPWWFSGYEDPTRRFFSQVLAALDGRSEAIATARARIAEFAEVVDNSTRAMKQSVSKLVGRMGRDGPGHDSVNGWSLGRTLEPR